MTFKEICKNEEINAYLKKGDENLGQLGYTDHSQAHCVQVARQAGKILERFGYSDHEIELVKIAGYMHDIGNAINRTHHAEYGALLANSLLKEMDMPLDDRITIISAIGNHDDWWMDNKPALNLFESIEPNGTVELEGLGTVNLSHFPYREDLAYGWPDDAVRFHDQALPFDGRKLLYGHTHQLSPAGARPESLNVNSARTAGLRQVDMGAELGVRPRQHVAALRDFSR